jgi:hypothetical protein
LKLVLENGVLSNQNVKPGHMLISCNSWSGEGISHLWKSQQNPARDIRLCFFQLRGQEEWSSEITDIV